MSRNSDGKNQWGEKTYPPDEELRSALHQYAIDRFTQRQVLGKLAKDFDLHIGLTKLKALYTKFEVPTTRRPYQAADVLHQAVVDQINNDLNDCNGPRYIKDKLRDQGIFIPRDKIREIMLQLKPEGFDNRMPGKGRVPRKGLTSIGIWESVSSDGHEKLTVLALRMGAISLPIYAFKDKWSDYLLYIVVVPNARNAVAVGHLFLDFLEKYQIIPLQMTTDKGSEVAWIFAFQNALREIFAPQIDTNIFLPHVHLKSVHNTVIEGFWSWLLSKQGFNVKERVLQGMTQYIFNPNSTLHENLFYWIFVPLLQAELNSFQRWWNYHRVRSQAEKHMPSGHVPAHVFADPESRGGIDCGIRITQDAINTLRAHLEQDEGPRNECLEFITPEFSLQAGTVHALLGLPQADWNNAWDIFQSMVSHPHFSDV
ncbi:hypothetical protein M422DRAFT_214129 [Sphaerobolus stellatus SS14]|uniref:Integrase core domain-containing protein n=1 Tax=Sphaerobolus stellatus (strain SS14) TaxID=990650 RepID=A0A0C9UBI2_SPHS4|nr:hypothetical protein M422DRAFT_214129 [Sphaerobolus stellatus SS14]